MELEMHISGKDANEETTAEIEDWLRNAGIPGLVVKQKGQAPKTGEMGFDLVSVLVGPIGEAAKSVFDYLGTRRPDLKIDMKVGEINFNIDAKNLKNQDEILSRLVAIAESKGK